jgi:hypothetical protein
MPDAVTERESAEKLVADAMNLMRRAYYSDVRDDAREIKAAIENDEISDREALQDRIHETCDGSQWVIYTFKAQIVLLASDNDGAYGDSYGSEGIVTDGAINWSALAYAAMERDITEALESENVNVNGDTKAELLELDDTDDDAALLAPSDIPADFPVRPLEPGQSATDKATCGVCGLSWDDAIVTSMTPAPSGRCPFEHFHATDAEG